MPHVLEGQLHAYLDGALTPSNAAYAEIQAHLASCADCRAQLERERALRTDATAILARAVPRVAAMPSFDQISARGASRQQLAAQSVKRGIPPARLALAASLVLAMGGALLTTAIVRRNVAREDAVMMSAQPSPATVAAPPVSPPAASGVAGADVPRIAQAPGAPPPAVSSPPATRADARRSREERQADFSAQGKEGAASKGVVAAAAPPPSPPVVATADARAQTAAGVKPLAARDALSNSAAAGAPVTPEAARWVSVDRVEAERRLGSKVLTVPNLSVRSFEVPVPTEKRVVRVMQTLASGASLELIEQAVEVPARALQRAENAREKQVIVKGTEAGSAAEQKKAGAAVPNIMNEVTVIRGSVQIQARAPIQADTLRELVVRAN